MFMRHPTGNVQPRVQIGAKGNPCVNVFMISLVFQQSVEIEQQNILMKYYQGVN